MNPSLAQYGNRIVDYAKKNIGSVSGNRTGF